MRGTEGRPWPNRYLPRPLVSSLLGTKQLCTRSAGLAVGWAAEPPADHCHVPGQHLTSLSMQPMHSGLQGSPRL